MLSSDAVAAYLVNAQYQEAEAHSRHYAIYTRTTGRAA